MKLETEAAIIDDELIRAFYSGDPCPECGGSRFVLSEDGQDAEDCPSCERVMTLLLDAITDKIRDNKDRDNVVRVFVDPDTKKIDTIPF